MKYTFKLKEPNTDKETSILFSCFFKDENKKFIYSTGEIIHPANFDKINKFPFTSGKNKSKFAESIKMQLNRYSDLLQKTVNERKATNDLFTSEVLKKVFDLEFKKVTKGSNIFFEVYDLFTAFKESKSEWSDGTKVRYQNIRNMLEKFEIAKNYKLTFAKINDKFDLEFRDYCLYNLHHINNTYLKNLVLFKTFMHWSLKNKHTYNAAFKTFNINDSGKTIIKESTTSQIALTIEDLHTLMQYEFKTKKLEHSRDIFVLQCVTGMRYGELSLINSSNTTAHEIILKEKKGVFKAARSVPLNSLSRHILIKYNYDLSLITNQKQNDYIKDVFKELEYTGMIEKYANRGREVLRSEEYFYNRINTHTARRTFITMMKRQGMSDKVIASISGHKDIATLNKYYIIDDEQKREAMEAVFNIEIPLRVIK